MDSVQTACAICTAVYDTLYMTKTAVLHYSKWKKSENSYKNFASYGVNLVYMPDFY